MHRLPIHGKLLFLIQRNDVTLRQIIDFHRLLQALNLTLASLLIIHLHCNLVSLGNHYTFSHHKVTLFLVGMIEQVVTPSQQFDENGILQLYTIVIRDIEPYPADDGIIYKIHLLRAQQLSLNRWSVLQQLEYHVGLLNIFQIVLDGFGMTDAHYLSQRVIGNTLGGIAGKIKCKFFNFLVVR